MSDQDKAEGFEACRTLVLFLLASRPVVREYDVRDLGNPFDGHRNAHDRVNASQPIKGSE